jgi:hypothetical protein
MLRGSVWAALGVAVSLFGGPPAFANQLPPVDAAPAPPSVVVRPTPPQFIWPAYKYPDLSDARSQWRRAIATGRGQSFIVNPANGPGKLANDDYRSVIAEAREAGIALLGYVYTDYGARPIAQVRADITRWQSLYGIRDIFLDEAASRVGQSGDDRTLIDYYRGLHTFVHGNAGAVVLNPGVVPDHEYVEVADSIVTFEGSATAYATTQFPRWTVDVPDRMITHIVYRASAIVQAEVVQRAHVLGAGLIFVTDDGGPNPYDSLPSYYELERAELRAMG